MSDASEVQRMEEYQKFRKAYVACSRMGNFPQLLDALIQARLPYDDALHRAIAYAEARGGRFRVEHGEPVVTELECHGLKVRCYPQSGHDHFHYEG